MPYQAEQDVTIPRCIGYREIPGTTERVELKESANYPTGAVIFEKDMTPEVLARLEQGDDHLSTLLRYIDVAEARQILGHQVQSAASQSSPEDEILHSEERLGGGQDSSSPTVDPEVEVGVEPPYESPPAGGEVSDSGTSDMTDPPSVETEETETAIEEETGGSTESSGESTDEVIEETEVEAVEESSTDDQQNGQDPDTETQEEIPEAEATEEVTTDKFDEMDFDELKSVAKAQKLPGRSKLKTEDALRTALRAVDSE